MPNSLAQRLKVSNNIQSIITTCIVIVPSVLVAKSSVGMLCYC